MANILEIIGNGEGQRIVENFWSIVSEFKEKAKIIRAAREINNYKTEWVIEKIKNKALEFELKEGKKPVIACFGLAFKADIDDLRESPALYVVESLIEHGFEVLAVEPNVENDKKLDFDLVTMEEAIEKLDLGYKLVNHRAFKILPSIINDFVK